MMLRSLARNVEYGLVGGTLSCAAGMLAYIQTVFSSASKGFPFHDIVMRFLIRAICLCTVALQRLASRNLSPLAKAAKSYPCCSKILMKSNFMTMPKHGERISSLGGGSRRGNGRDQTMFVSIVRHSQTARHQQSRKEGGHRRRHDGRRGLRPNPGYCMSETCRAWHVGACFGSVRHVISLLHPFPHGR